MTPKLLRNASTGKPQMNHGIIFTRFTLCPLPDSFSSFCFWRVPMNAKTKAVGIMAIVRVSLTIVAKSPAASEKPSNEISAAKAHGKGEDHHEKGHFSDREYRADRQRRAKKDYRYLQHSF